MVRAKISQNKAKELPSKAVTGTSSLLSYPIINLAAWGTMSPIKPSSPAKLIALPANNDDRTIKIKRYLATFKPRDFAVSSPKERTFIS